MAKTPLTPVIQIDEEKCINCYACIVICPVKYCMNGSADKLQINHDLCIGCGNCINACTYKARTLIDNTGRFMDDLKQKEKIIAVAAPAVASFFPDQFLNLNGWLKSLGVEAFFDVSLGAELTIMSYLNYIKDKNPRAVISQPCPAIVTFIDDEETILTMTKGALQGDYNVTTVNSAKAALDLFLEGYTPLVN